MNKSILTQVLVVAAASAAGLAIAAYTAPLIGKRPLIAIGGATLFHGIMSQVVQIIPKPPSKRQSKLGSEL